ncbi:hypothetical protein I4U23_011368 [Adineta vaga]|nr:hypothetical protein I4U23_011368 [Adineta vaga]
MSVYINAATHKPDHILLRDYVIDQTLHSQLTTDVHAVKDIRIVKNAEKDYISKQGLYLKTVDRLNKLLLNG